MISLYEGGSVLDVLHGTERVKWDSHLNVKYMYDDVDNNMVHARVSHLCQYHSQLTEVSMRKILSQIFNCSELLREMHQLDYG